MKKVIKWIFVTIMIGIVIVVVSFIYCRWGFTKPGEIAVNESFSAGDFEFVIEDTVNIPGELVHSYLKPNSTKKDHLISENGIVLIISVTNKSDETLVLQDEVNFKIDQINDPKILQLLHLHFYENFHMPVVYNPRAPEENIIYGVHTKLEAKETKKLHFIFLYDETENNEYNFQIGDWLGNTLFNRQIEISRIKPCNKIETKNLSIKPLEIYQNGYNYGITLRIQNNSNKRQSISDMLEGVAIENQIWDNMALESIIYDGKETNVSDFYLEPHKEYEVNLVGSKFIGNGDFYIRISDLYYRFLLE